MNESEGTIDLSIVKTSSRALGSSEESNTDTHHEEASSSEDEESLLQEDVTDANDDAWENAFQRFVEFKNREEHVMVPFRYKEDRKLGKWVAAQRQIHEKVSLSEQKTPSALAERFRRLDEVGFEWKAKDPRHVPWTKRYDELIDFVNRFGHAQVPIGWKENPKLSNWVSAQRQEYRSLLRGRPSRLTDHRVRQLNAVNFIFEARRGGPKRQSRATELVPAEPTPARGSEARRATLIESIEPRAKIGSPDSKVKSPLTKRAKLERDIVLESSLKSFAKKSRAASSLSSPTPKLTLHSNQQQRIPETSAPMERNNLLAQMIMQSQTNSFPPGINASMNPAITPHTLAAYASASHNLLPNAEMEALAQLDSLRRITNTENILRQYADLSGSLPGALTVPHIHARESLMRRLAPQSVALEGGRLPFASTAPIAVPSPSTLQHDPRLYSIIPLATPPEIEETGFQYALMPRSFIQDLQTLQQRSQANRGADFDRPQHPPGVPPRQFR